LTGPKQRIVYTICNTTRKTNIIAILLYVLTFS